VNSQATNLKIAQIRTWQHFGHDICFASNQHGIWY